MAHDENTGKSPDEIAAGLGERLRALRLAADLTQAVVADKAGVSERSLRDLEAGQGSTVQTLVVFEITQAALRHPRRAGGGRLGLSGGEAQAADPFAKGDGDLVR